MASAAADREAQRREHNEQKELESLRRVFEALDRNKVGKIGFKELNDQLVKLDYRAKRVEVEDMIWEVDEDCDRCVNWEEFKTMFYRVRHDKSGWEPRRLFNVVEFMMHDKDMSGTIDMDECMEILFRRFGKDELEQRTNEFFKHDEDGDNNISFVEFQRQARAVSRPPRTSARARGAHAHRPRGRWASSGRSGATRRARPNRRAARA